MFGHLPYTNTPRQAICSAGRRALPALLLLIGLLAGGAAHAQRPGPGKGAAGPADFTQNGWTNRYSTLRSVSVVSAREFWALGDGGHVLHYLDGAWTDVDPPALRNTYRQGNISMTGANAGWVLTGGRVYQYNGRTWTERPAGLNDVLPLQVAAVSADDAWLLATNCAAGCRPGLLHWTGAAWSLIDPGLPVESGLYHLAFSSAGEGWAVGSGSADHPGSILLHYDGSAWAALAGPPGARGLSLVWAGSANDAWMTGRTAAGTQAIYHYAAGAWSSQPIASERSFYDLYMRSDAEGWALLDDSILHWDGSAWQVETRYPSYDFIALGGSAGQVWAVGAADRVLQRGGAGIWAAIHGGPTGHTLRGVSALSLDDAWAVGGDPLSGAALLHWNGSAWRAMSSPVPQPLVAVQMLSPTEGYALAASEWETMTSFNPMSLNLRWDGLRWQAVATTTGILNGFFALPGGETWAVGDGGAIRHFAGGAWTAVPSPTTHTLNKVAFDSPTHGWAVGGYFDADADHDQPVLLEYSSSAWTDRTSTLPPFYAGELDGLVLAPGGTEGWAVGTGPTLRLTGGQWVGLSSMLAATKTAKEAPQSWAAGLNDVALDGAGGAWAVGSSVYHLVGSTGQLVQVPPSPMLFGVSCVAGSGCWAVGVEGTIMRYDARAPGQQFYDVPPAQPFYPYIAYMADHGIVGGYSDGTFRPYNNVTRGQIAKLVVLARGWMTATSPTATFSDVPPTHPFHGFVEAAAAHGIISGYTCDSLPSETCDAQHRPYFRPQADLTRGQIAKIVVGAMGWTPYTPTSPRFTDVPARHPFYGFVERAAQQNILGGYGCGGADPCPGTYFHPAGPATRGQVSKILYLAVTVP